MAGARVRDAEANLKGEGRISRPDSRAAALVLPTNEELMIARHTRAVLEAARRQPAP